MNLSGVLMSCHLPRVSLESHFPGIWTLMSPEIFPIGVPKGDRTGPIPPGVALEWEG